MVLDHYGLDPNPARDKRVKLPRERKAHVPPPLAEHVERSRRGSAPARAAATIVDECGPRVNELATAQVGDLDEHRRAIRVRSTVEKNERYRHLELPDDLFEALVATLPPREDRDLEAPLFPDLTDAGCGQRSQRRARRPARRILAARTTPPRGSLYYKRTGSLAEVAELLGDSKRVAADHTCTRSPTTARSTGRSRSPGSGAVA